MSELEARHSAHRMYVIYTSVQTNSPKERTHDGGDELCRTFLPPNRPTLLALQLGDALERKVAKGEQLLSTRLLQCVVRFLSFHLCKTMIWGVAGFLRAFEILTLKSSHLATYVENPPISPRRIRIERLSRLASRLSARRVWGWKQVELFTK